MEKMLLALEVLVPLGLLALGLYALLPRRRKAQALLLHKEERSTKVMMLLRTEQVPQFTLSFQLGERTRSFVVSKALYESLEEGQSYALCWDRDRLLSCEPISEELPS